MRSREIAVVCTAVLMAACSSQPPVEPATTILRGGHIVTMEASQPSAQAIAIRGDRIVALGTNDEIQKYAGPNTNLIELAGQTAIPGFIEGHGHFIGVGQSRMVIDLMDVTSFDEIVAKVGAAAKTAAPGEWIQGRGWHQEKWSTVPTPNVEGFPYHDALSKVSPNNPVMLEHASGHAAYANAKAMELAGVTATHAESAGRRDPEGQGRAADWRVPRDRRGADRQGAGRLASGQDARAARRRREAHD